MPATSRESTETPPAGETNNTMGKNMVILAVIVTAAYLVGVESAKSRGKNYEDLRHQIERLWKSPDARKARRRMGKNLRTSIGRASKRVLGD